jgi:hypothetical protein
VTNPPAADADDLTWLLFCQDGVISRRQALRIMSEAHLRHLVAAGRWSRRHRGVFVAHNGPITEQQRVWIGSLAAGAGRPAPLAGSTALVTFGLRGVPSSRVHVYLPHRMRATSTPHYVVPHRTTALTGADYLGGHQPRTTPARSVIDAARWAESDDQARVVITAAFQQRLVDGTAMLTALARMPRFRRRNLITVTIHDAAGGTESVSEQDFLRLCRRGRLPVPTRQSVVVDAAGRRRYRDAYFEQWHVHVEIDGGQHVDVANWWADMRRQNDMGIGGDRVLRFPAWTIRNEPDAVIAQLRAALEAAGWIP